MTEDYNMIVHDLVDTEFKLCHNRSSKKESNTILEESMPKYEEEKEHELIKLKDNDDILKEFRDNNIWYLSDKQLTQTKEPDSDNLQHLRLLQSDL